MRLQLKNFRCHTSGDFVLPNTGMVLLTGQSGAGKTTILNAIEYVLYGKTRKPYSHGKTTCSVTLDYETVAGATISVTRTSKPNRLLVTYEETDYEDEAAQGVIENVLGMNSAEFMASSYIVQRLDASVLSMTPAEGVQFIETLAFNDNSHTETKKKIREFIRQANDRVQTINGEIRVLERQLEAMRPEEVLEGDVPDSDEIHSAVSQLEEDISSVTSTTKTKQAQLKAVRDKERESQEARAARSKLEVEKAQLERMRSSLSVKDSVSIEEVEAKLKKLEDATNRDAVYKSLSREVTRLTELKASHMQSMVEQKTDLEKKLRPDKEITKLLALVTEAEQKSTLAHEYESLKQRKEDARKRVTALFKEIAAVYPDAKPHKTPKAMIEYLKSKVCSSSCALVKCPRCDTPLLFDQNKLTEASKDRYLAPHDTGFLYNVLDDADKKYLYHHETKTVIGMWDVAKEKARPIMAEERDALIKAGRAVYQPEGKMKVAEFFDIMAVALTSSRDSTRGPGHDSAPEAQVSGSQVTGVNTWITQLEQLAPDMNIKLPEEVSFDMNDVLRAREVLTEHRVMQARVESISADIEKQTFPASITKLSESVKQKCREFEGYDEYLASASTDAVNKERKALEDQHRVLMDHKSLTVDLEKKNRQLKNLPRSVTLEASSVDIELEIDELNKTHQALLSELKLRNRDMAVLMKYEAAMKEREHRITLERELKETRKTLKQAEARLRGAQGLEEASKQAEILAVERTVESINEHAQIYLSEMFEDEITVRLEGFKKAKSGDKPMMNVSIEYKGSSYGSVDELSGGERQRCNLAFLLAVNDMLNSPLLLLDECINNLDAEVNMAVLDIIKASTQNKLVLVVSHEAVHGCFDEIIHV